MAPRGGPEPPPPRPGTKTGVFWANVVGARSKPELLAHPPHLTKAHFDKVKNYSVASMTIDDDLWMQAKAKMQSLLYTKFLGKALPLDQAKLALADAGGG